MRQKTHLSLRELIGPIVIAGTLSVIFSTLAAYSLNTYLDSADVAEAVASTVSVVSDDTGD